MRREAPKHEGWGRMAHKKGLMAARLILEKRSLSDVTLAA